MSAFSLKTWEFILYICIPLSMRVVYIHMVRVHCRLVTVYQAQNNGTKTSLPVISKTGLCISTHSKVSAWWTSLPGSSPAFSRREAENEAIVECLSLSLSLSLLQPTAWPMTGVHTPEIFMPPWRTSAAKQEAERGLTKFPSLKDFTFVHCIFMFHPALDSHFYVILVFRSFLLSCTLIYSLHLCTWIFVTVLGQWSL